MKKHNKQELQRIKSDAKKVGLFIAVVLGICLICYLVSIW